MSKSAEEDFAPHRYLLLIYSVINLTLITSVLIFSCGFNISICVNPFRQRKKLIIIHKSLYLPYVSTDLFKKIQITKPHNQTQLQCPNWYGRVNRITRRTVYWLTLYIVQMPLEWAKNVVSYIIGIISALHEWVRLKFSPMIEDTLNLTFLSKEIASDTYFWWNMKFTNWIIFFGSPCRGWHFRNMLITP